jgi:2-dehydropantoate 2-reductase
LQYTKLLVNLNNAVHALSGLPLKEELGNHILRTIFSECQREALQVFKANGIELARFGLVVPELAPIVLALPNWLYLRLTPVVITDKAQGSMWEDLQRGNPTEIDYLNGEVVALAKKKRLRTPCNEAIVALVRQAEQQRKCPKIPPHKLYRLVLGKPYQGYMSTSFLTFVIVVMVVILFFYCVVTLA